MFCLPYDRVLVPVDMSEASLATVEIARVAIGETDTLHVIHVIPHTDGEHVLRDQQRLKERLHPAPRPTTVIVTRQGNPVEEIIAYAKEIEADLIMIPTAGRSGLGRFLIGSVAEKVVQHAHCPVLVLRGGF